ncbi:hypothetical protein BEH76_09790 [Shewanella algae]|nr:hypothetical protein BEH76_09790 [Shewanella algae]
MFLSSTVVQLGAHIVQAGRGYAIGLTFDRFDQFFDFEFFENGEGTVAKNKPFAAITFNGCDAT